MSGSGSGSASTTALVAHPPPSIAKLFRASSEYPLSCSPDRMGLRSPSNATTRPCSLIGEPVTLIVERMLDASAADGDSDEFNGSRAVAAAGLARTEFCIAWPPTFPVGGPAEVIELRAAVSIHATASPAAAGDTSSGASSDPAVSGAAVASRDAALTAAAVSCCSRMLAMRDDVVVGDEAVKLLPGGGGRARARLRLHADTPGVTSCVLTGDQGIPTLESFQDAAPLVGLPQAARDEAHRLLWRMMHEALPPNHSILPYDPDAFRSPMELLPLKLQAALSWAWTHHFRPFVHDFSFLLESLPVAGTADSSGAAVAAVAAAAGAGTSPTTVATGAGGDGSQQHIGETDELAHYQSVLAQMVVFLRDNDMFACLATLLQTAVARGLLLLLGEDRASSGMAAMAEARSLPPPLPLASPSVSSEDIAGGLAAVDASFATHGGINPTGVIAAAAVAATAAPIIAAACRDLTPQLHTAALVEAHADKTELSFPSAVPRPSVKPLRQLLQVRQFQLLLLLSLCLALLAAVHSCCVGPSRSSWGLVKGMSLLLVAHVGLLAVHAATFGNRKQQRMPSVCPPLTDGCSNVYGNGDCPSFKGGDSNREVEVADIRSRQGVGDGNSRWRKLAFPESTIEYLIGTVLLAVATWYGAVVAAAAAAVTAAPREVLAAAASVLLLSSEIWGWTPQ